MRLPKLTDGLVDWVLLLRNEHTAICCQCYALLLTKTTNQPVLSADVRNLKRNKNLKDIQVNTQLPEKRKVQEMYYLPALTIPSVDFCGVTALLDCLHLLTVLTSTK